MTVRVLMEQLKNETEAGADCLQPQNAGPSVINTAVEIFNPFEALEVIVEEPMAALFFVVIVSAVVLIACGLWSVVQEAFLGGGPPQSLGLK
jgi:hypothetical protein